MTSTDLTLYMRLDVDDLLARTLHRRRLDDWESGMDQNMGEDIFDSFDEHETRLVSQYDCMSKEFKAEQVDARNEEAETQRQIRLGAAARLGISKDRGDLRIPTTPAVAVAN